MASLSGLYTTPLRKKAPHGKEDVSWQNKSTKPPVPPSPFPRPRLWKPCKPVCVASSCGPGDAPYDDARTIHIGMIDRHPALIVQCTGVADVINAVNFARVNHLLVSVRGGGHKVAGFAVCDDGIMIDLSGMKSVWVDPARQTARAEGGATWGDLDHETQVFGLATTGGVVRSTGIAGLTLGGGHGHLMRRFGLACDN